jgi:alpha/beta superfamily hydrolase
MMRTPLFIAATLLTQTLAGTAHAAPPEQVTFTSGGEKIVGLLYRPADAPAGHRPPVVVVAPPWLNVKEQVATRYAQALADRGVAALAFDYRHWGQSGGAPRELESATAKVADLRAAVAFLKSRRDVAADRIGLLGICFGAGHALTASAGNADVKAVATVAAWLHDRPTLVATFGRDEVDRRYRVAREARAKWEKDPAATDYVPAASNTDRTAGMYATDPGFFYTDATRGAVPQWTNRMAVMSWTEWLDLDGVAAAAKVTQPLLVVHSDGSALPDNVRKAFAAATGPKDLLWTQGEHTQFYDEPALVAKAADAVAAHFRRTLGGGGGGNGNKEAANPGGAGVRPASDAAVREFFAALEAMDIDRFLGVWA